ncbi:MAG: hypothetical protein R2715_00790 [Ilumatobacteraceae bacterium]
MAPNLAPVVDAEADVSVMLPEVQVGLSGSVSDDGAVLASPVLAWSGPAGVVFDDPTSLATVVRFPGGDVHVDVECC